MHNEARTNNKENDENVCAVEQDTTERSKEAHIYPATDGALCQSSVYRCMDSINPVEQKRVEHDDEHAHAGAIQHLVEQVERLDIAVLKNQLKRKPQNSHCFQMHK